MNCGISSAGAILNYLEMTKHDMISHITSISRIDESHCVLLDKFTLRNLELLHSAYEEGRSLVDIIDRTITPMGGRTLRRWICMPLKSPEEINQRLDIVDHFIRQEDQRLQAENFLESIGDLERLASKIGVGRITPREMNQLKIALSCIAPLKDLCQQSESAVMKKMTEPLNPCTELFDKIKFQLQENAPHQVNKGGVIATGVNAELDELRNISSNGKELLLQMQQREIEATGIPSLKIGFNNVFGYYIEVTKAHKDKAPANWIRKQTLVNGERYITPELKEYEDKILGAEDRILAIETELYNNLLQEAAGYIRPLQEDAKIISALDVLISFAEISIANNYHRPEINDSDVLDIKAGRHPVIEKQLPPGEEYISNDVLLDNKKQQIIIITGPNMAGKSTYMRQVALITLMAQIGSFVPAEYARISVVDKIFTRIGASDDLTAGQSTFMVEMKEVSDILNYATQNSLVILDEVGRGTSTLDGVSIARAVAEYISSRKIGCKTLFATHYHELLDMEQKTDGVKNYSVAVKKHGDSIRFLRKIVPGGVDDSYGIAVAKLAGLPDQVVKRAKQVLSELEQQSASAASPAEHAAGQISFAQMQQERVIATLQKTNLAELSDKECRELLTDLTEMLS